jgi:hypothetical protein
MVAMTGTMSASTTRVRTASEPLTPMLTIHWKAKFHFHENAYEALDTAIDCEDVAYATGRGCQVCEVVQRVDEREGRGAVKRSTVIEGGGDADGRLVCVRDAEVDLAHVCAGLGSA